MMSLLLLCVCFQDFTYTSLPADLVVGELGVITLEVSGDMPTQGFSMRLGLTSIAGVQDIIPALELGSPEFFMSTDAGIVKTIGCVFSLQSPVFHSFPVGGEPAVLMLCVPTQAAAVGVIWLGLGNVVVIDNQDVIPTMIGGAVNITDNVDPEFLRGDANGDTSFSISDGIAILNHTFGSFVLPCASAADFNDNGSIALDDAVGLLGFLFGAGNPPGLPFPACGPDPTPDALTCVAGCP